MKKLVVTVGFDLAVVHGILELSDEAVDLIEQNPDHVISFEYLVSGDTNETNEVIGASIIPSENVPNKKFKELIKERKIE